MLTKRIIPCLDIQDGRTVKGVNFINIRDAGDPVELGKKYADDGADELVFLDITATHEGRKTFAELVKRIAENLNIPFTVGGGISTVEDVEILLGSGADKVSINSSAVKDPDLINKLSERFGSQCIVVAIDAKNINGKWIVHTHGGRNPVELELFSWAQEVEDRGAGEILFTSMDHDGRKEGFAIDALQKLHSLLKIPVIASGGGGKINHFVDAFNLGSADAALAASIFHYNEIPVPVLKEKLRQAGINVRG
jgi:imidazole glycerol-phosphate synthase subunit HisF